MKRNVWNEMKLFALAGVMSLTLLGCGGKGGAKEEPPAQEEQQEDLNTEGQEAPQGERKNPKVREKTQTLTNRQTAPVHRMRKREPEKSQSLEMGSSPLKSFTRRQRRMEARYWLLLQKEPKLRRGWSLKA